MVNSQTQVQNQIQTQTQAQTASPLSENQLKLKSTEKRQLFERKLTGLKDAKKKKTIILVDSRLNNLNKKAVMSLQQKTMAMERVSTKLRSRLTKMNQEGKDIAQFEPELANLNQKINSLKSQVSIQLQKDYSPQITEEVKLRISAQEATTQLKTDFQNLNTQFATIHNEALKIITQIAL